MKNILSLLIVVMMFLFVVPVVEAQTEKYMSTAKVGNNITYSQTVGTSADPMDTLISYDSQTISLASYDYYWNGTYQIKFVSAILVPKITTTIEGTFDGTNWFAVDTLGAVADSTETVRTGVITNLPLKRYPYYRVLHTPLIKSPSDVVGSVQLYFTKPE
jgi:hypothetical protein